VAGTELGVEQLRGLIRSIPDFPRAGIVFYDVTPLFAEPAALTATVELLAAEVESAGPVDLVIGAEARGFILGPALAVRLGAGFVPARSARSSSASAARSSPTPSWSS
jgi:adenine phosphoribosyltransferase